MSYDDQRDPLQAAVDNYQRPPRDVVPHHRHPVDDITRFADGTAQPVTYYDITDQGITRHTARVVITRPITTKEIDKS